MSLRKHYDPNHKVVLKEYTPLMESFQCLVLKKDDTSYKTLKENRRTFKPVSREDAKAKFLESIGR